VSTVEQHVEDHVEDEEPDTPGDWVEAVHSDRKESEKNTAALNA